MAIARAAAREAVSNLNAATEHAMPGAVLPPSCPTTDPGLLFARSSRAMRQAVALEACIVAGDLPPLRTSAAPPNPHHTGARQIPTHPTGQTPGRTSQNPFQLETLEPLEQEFFGVTDHRPVPVILAAIREALGLGTNASQAQQATPPTEPIPPTPRTPPAATVRSPSPPRPG